MNSITIDSAACKGCGLCISVCPSAALLQGSMRNSMGYPVPDAEVSRCSGCLTCEYICPDMAITIHREKETEPCATK